MTRVNKNTWTATLDRTLLLHILWESGVTLRDWSGVAAALGPGFSTTICENRYELLIKHVKLCLESVNEMPSSPGPMSLPMPGQTVSPRPGQSAQPSSQAHQTTENSEEEGAMWEFDEAETEPASHQPKSKKRKSNGQGGRASTVVEVDEDEGQDGQDGQDVQEIDSEQLRTPHGQRTSNISFTRTNTVQKIFTPAAAKAPNGPAQQANTTRRQQTQQQTSTQGPRNGNFHANNPTGNNNTGTASNNGPRCQSNNARGRGRSRGGHGQYNMSRANHRQNTNTKNARN